MLFSIELVLQVPVLLPFKGLLLIVKIRTVHRLQLSEPGIVRWLYMLGPISGEIDRRHSPLEPTHLPWDHALHGIYLILASHGVFVLPD